MNTNRINVIKERVEAVDNGRPLQQPERIVDGVAQQIACDDAPFLLTALDAVSAMVPHEEWCKARHNTGWCAICEAAPGQPCTGENCPDESEPCTCNRQQRIDAAIEAAVEGSENV